MIIRHSRGLQSIIYTLVQSGPELALLGMILSISGLIFSRFTSMMTMMVVMFRRMMTLVMVIWMVTYHADDLSPLHAIK